MAQRGASFVSGIEAEVAEDMANQRTTGVGMDLAGAIAARAGVSAEDVVRRESNAYDEYDMTGGECVHSAARGLGVHVGGRVAASQTMRAVHGGVPMHARAFRSPLLRQKLALPTPLLPTSPQLGWSDVDER